MDFAVARGDAELLDREKLLFGVDNGAVAELPSGDCFERNPLGSEVVARAFAGEPALQFRRSALARRVIRQVGIQQRFAEPAATPPAGKGRAAGGQMTPIAERQHRAGVRIDEPVVGDLIEQFGRLDPAVARQRGECFAVGHAHHHVAVEFPEETRALFGLQEIVENGALALA